MTVLHFYQTDFRALEFSPEQFSEHMTEAAKKAGHRSFRDMRFRVAKAIKAWAEAEHEKNVRQLCGKGL